MIKELIIILAALFAWGVAGGLEKGMLTIPGALLAWGAAVAVIVITIFAGRGRRA